MDSHGSYINNKSAPLPQSDDVRDELERFLRRLGYRLVLREIRHAKQAKCGEPIVLEMKWRNVGSAPCYRPYRVAYRISNKSGYVRTLVGAVTVDKWMPGSVETFTEEFLEQPPDLPPGETVEVADRIVLPGDVQAGEYRLAIGVVGEDSTQPIIRLGIKGRTDDGWYPLSQLLVLK